MNRTSLLGACLALVALFGFGACNSQGSATDSTSPSEQPTLSDAQQVWCSSNTGKVFVAANALGLQRADTVQIPNVRLYPPGEGPHTSQEKAQWAAQTKAVNDATTKAKAVQSGNVWPQYPDFTVDTTYYWFSMTDYPRACQAAFAARS